MARIQILELPMEHVGDASSTPFVLVIDQADDAFHHQFVKAGEPKGTAEIAFAEAVGARAVLIFPGTVEIPANNIEVDGQSYPLVVRIEGDFEDFREQVQDEIARAQAEVGEALKRGR